MKNWKKTLGVSLLCLAVLFTGCTTVGQVLSEIHVEAKTAPMSEERGELRGVWLATVFNIDYPSRATTDDSVLRNEAIQVLDNIQAMGFNAVFLQVRPTSDAIYPSEIFPWSHWLTGTQGVAPNNGFDPLAFFIEEAHKRGIELHAWLNPYRITSTRADNDRLAPSNPAVRYPELTVLHADGRLYFNPGMPAARQLIIDGIAEILRNYNVDGIHLDDYFYPSESDGAFPDHETFQRYGTGFDNIADWRRHNNTELIKGIQAVVREIRPDAAFGVSPFGIWANRGQHPAGSDTRGNDSHFRMFADTRLWVQQGYLDYIMPQLYWHIGFEIADYETLLAWWTDVVQGTGVRLYIGMGAYRVVGVEPGNRWYGSQEIRRQMAMNRQNSSVSGYVMFTYNSFMRVPSLKATITELNAQGGNAPAAVFPDIVGLPQRESIEYVASLGIIRGFEDGTFRPFENIKRRDFVLMLTRMFDLPIQQGLSNFNDVLPGTYYFNEVATARARGLIHGIDGIHFAPAANITNQDLYVMAYRALEQMGKISGQADESILAQYTDGDEIAYYARQAIAYFTETGVFERNRIYPTQLADRAGAAEFIANVVRANSL